MNWELSAVFVSEQLAKTWIRKICQEKATREIKVGYYAIVQ